MKYYITADVHGYYSLFHKSLDEAGYFTDSEPHKLIILGDIFDRGQEAVEMQRFILSLLVQDAAILVRGNHEDLFEEMSTIDVGQPVLRRKTKSHPSKKQRLSPLLFCFSLYVSVRPSDCSARAAAHSATTTRLPWTESLPPQ